MCKGLFRLLVSCKILFLVIPDVLPFNPNTPEFVANRRKMLDLVVYNDKCNELNHLSRTMETAQSWHKIIKPRKYRRAQSKLREWYAALSVGDEACKEALYLWTTLPGDEMAQCAGAVSPMCQNYPETGWICGVYWHDADRIDPPLEFPFKYCLQKSLEVDAAFRKEGGPDVGAGRSPGHQRRNSPNRGSKNSDMSGRNPERNRKNAEANRQESSRSSDGEDKAPIKSYSLITQYSDDSSSSQRSQSSSGTNSQRSKRSNGRESQKSRSRKRENFEAERQAVVAAAAAVAANGALVNAKVKKDEKADKMRNKQKMVQDWTDSDGEKYWGTGGDGDLNTGNSHQHDVKSPVRDSPRVRKRGRATSSPNSSPNRAFNGNSLNVKLNKHYPGDVSIEP
ncbi:uncharacterized protein [Bemisia tabaci]|uniref:uncharacterized protein isoform X2 n=1 Tax=Bemisia tabaci TaxID=7038 RepID=UPI003B28379B